MNDSVARPSVFPSVRQSVRLHSDGRINGSLPFEIAIPSDPRQALNGHNGFLGSLASFIATSDLSKCHDFQVMNGANRPLVTDEPGWRVKGFRKITHPFRGIYGICLNLIRKAERFYTNRLGLETLGFWINYSQNTLPLHASVTEDIA